MFSVIIFLIAIVLANLSVAYFGPVATPFNSFLFIGLDLSLRDRIHEEWRGNNLTLKMFSLICAGAAITYLLNHDAGMICVGSIVAFSGALIVDAVIYEMLHKKRTIIKMNISNIASAATDSILFPTIAFGTFMPLIVLFQFLAKSVGGSLWAWILTRNAFQSFKLRSVLK